VKVCRVVAQIVSTVKHEAYAGTKLFAVQPLDERGHDIGQSYVAVDRARSGIGDTVLVLTEGNGARQLFGVAKLPIRSVIVGVVDEVHVP
jgi:microcompartment protein CcmK/EutM